MAVPFVDLKGQYHTLKADIDRVVLEVLDSSSYILGQYVRTFEQEVEHFFGIKHAIGVNSGTDALLLSLRAMDIGSGDEVITVSNSFFATAEAISLAGAKPVFVDVTEPSFNVDSELLEAAITPRTKAIIPVHLYGQPADMDEVLEVAERHGLRVIEDACQAFGAEYKGRRTGTLGHAAAFSFVPAKNLGCYGDGGMVTTNDDVLAERVRLLRDHGSSKKYRHEVVGYNSRLDALQAAILSVKLKCLDDWNEARRRLAGQYGLELRGCDVVLPTEAPDRKHIYHLYVIRTKNRDQLQAALREQGISTLIHYPIPIHLQPAFGDGSPSCLPVTQRLADEILSLPLWPTMPTSSVTLTSDAIKQILSQRQ